MWSLFFFDAAVVAVSLFLPGYLALRGLGVTRCLSFSFSPLLTVGAYVLLGLAYAQFGVWSSWQTQFVVLLIIGLAVFVFLRAKKRRVSTDAALGLSDFGLLGNRVSFDAICLALYLIFGIILASILFMWHLGSPDCYVQEYDNISHLGSIRGFIDSGIWSPFSSSLYATSADANINPLPSSGFYPTAWYSVAALAVTSVGVSIPCAENVANYVFIALVLPAGAFGLMRVLFDNMRSVVPFGAFFTLVFAGFPWMLLFFGPLYPNLSAFCMVPAAAAIFLLIFQKRCSAKWRVGFVGIFLMALISLAFSQPNSVFTLAVLLAPFCIWRASRLGVLFRSNAVSPLVLQVAFGCFAFVTIMGIWMALYNAPFMSAVVQHRWPPYTTDWLEALQDVAAGGLVADGSQVILSLLVFIGIAGTLKYRRYLWLSFSYGIACVIFVVNGCSDDPIKHVFSGFWYTDPWRCGAMVSLFGIFLGAFGLWLVWRALCLIVEYAGKGYLALRMSAAIAVCLVCLEVFGSTFPGISAPYSQTGAIAFRSVLSDLRTRATVAEVYDDAEGSFVKQVLNVVPNDALIINVPDDGSAFAFDVDGLRTYYRYTREYDVSYETNDSRNIRNNLCNVASDENVQDAVRDIGAQYVLQLDQGEPDIESPHLFTYENGEKWRGIDGIRDDTPGFEVILSEGDMRLYKITAV